MTTTNIFSLLPLDFLQTGTSSIASRPAPSITTFHKRSMPPKTTAIISVVVVVLAFLIILTTGLTLHRKHPGWYRHPFSKKGPVITRGKGFTTTYWDESNVPVSHPFLSETHTGMSLNQLTRNDDDHDPEKGLVEPANAQSMDVHATQSTLLSSQKSDTEHDSIPIYITSTISDSTRPPSVAPSIYQHKEEYDFDANLRLSQGLGPRWVSPPPRRSVDQKQEVAARGREQERKSPSAWGDRGGGSRGGELDVGSERGTERSRPRSTSRFREAGLVSELNL